jgi:hypothetical protein
MLALHALLLFAWVTSTIFVPITAHFPDIVKRDCSHGIKRCWACEKAWSSWDAIASVHLTPTTISTLDVSAALSVPLVDDTGVYTSQGDLRCSQLQTPTVPTSFPESWLEGGEFFNSQSHSQASVPQPTSKASTSVYPAAPSAIGADSTYINVVKKWRSAFGLPELSQDDILQNNAQKTADQSFGGLKHQLNPGSLAQVLAPGEAGEFEKVYVGGWLCEVQSAPALAGICGEASKGWAYDGQTGHAEILCSTSYSKIGCAHSDGTGVWACDLA